MIRTLLTTTALAVLMTAGTIAQDAPAETPADPAAPTTTEAPADPAAAPANEMAPADPAAAPPNEMAPADPAAAPANEMTPADPAMGGNVESGAMEETDVNEPWDMSTGYVAADTDNLATRLIDQPVYSSAGDDAEEIGNISDLVFDESGQITAVIIGVGGFLGIGEKAVAVDFQMLEFTIAADNTERWVLPTTADALTSAPDFVWEEDVPADGAVDDGAMDPAVDPAMAPADPAAPADAMVPAEEAPATN